MGTLIPEVLFEIWESSSGLHGKSLSGSMNVHGYIIILKLLYREN